MGTRRKGSERALASPPNGLTILSMPDRPFPAVDNLIRRAQRVAAGRPDPARILAQTISMACLGGADPYAVLGVLIEGTVQTLVENIPKERQAEIAATLKQLLEERMKASGIPAGDAPPRDRPKS
jgi:hypothetical protein